MTYRLIHDGLLDHPAFRGVGARRRPYSDAEAFIWLLQEARREPDRVPVGNTFVEIAEGQLTHSFRFMAAAWQWDLNKVRRYLDKLERYSIIDTVVRAGQLLVTICKFSDYQHPTKAANTQTDTVENSKPTHNRHKNQQEINKKKIEPDGSISCDEPVQLDLVDCIAERAAAEAAAPVADAEPEILPPEPAGEIVTLPSRCKPSGNRLFDEFYAEYPLKKSPKDALRAYIRAIRQGATHAELMAGLERYKHEVAGREPRHIKHPATWLNGGCWNDEELPCHTEPRYAQRIANSDRPIRGGDASYVLFAQVHGRGF